MKDQQQQSPIEDYLGDGVYAAFDGYSIILKANDHRRPTDTIYLEPAVLAALDRFKARVCPGGQEDKP